MANPDDPSRPASAPSPAATAPVPRPPPEDGAAPAVASAGLEFKALLLLLTMALLFAASTVYLLYARGAFEQTQRLVLIADDSEGVTVGMDMSFSGFPIGRVRRIELGEDGSARILIDVPVKDARWLRESSVFVLTRGLVGGTSLRAYSGVLDDPPLPPGAERRVLAGDATAEIPRLVASARELVTHLTALTRDDADLALALGELRRFGEALNGPGGLLGATVGDAALAQRMARTLASTADRADTLLARLDAAVQRVDGVVARTDERVLGPDGVLRDVQGGVAELRALLADTRGSFERLNGVLDEVRGIAGDVRGATTDLDVLRTEVEASLRRIDHLIGEVNRRWPFARETELKLP